MKSWTSVALAITHFRAFYFTFAHFINICTLMLAVVVNMQTFIVNLWLPASVVKFTILLNSPYISHLRYVSEERRRRRAESGREKDLNCFSVEASVFFSFFCFYLYSTFPLFLVTRHYSQREIDRWDHLLPVKALHGYSRGKKENKRKKARRRKKVKKKE